MSHPLIGTDVGRYRIERLLGEGGMGAVYLGVQPMIGSRVAVKVLSQECSRNPELLERFFAEARSVNLIAHENIVNVLDLAQLPDGRPYIVMEFVEGQTIGQIVRALIAQGQHVPMGGIVQVATEMLSALGAAHALGIVHRDLKPDNVLVTAEGHAKVLDFGIAKLAPGLNQHSPRTRTGALLGTPAYMAPEQISGAGSVDSRTDIYAAGVVLFEAMTGTQPFSGDTLFDLMRAHMEQAPPSPRQRRPEMPLSIEHVILTALAKDPAHRFQSAGAMAQALRQAANDLPADQWRSLSGRSLAGGRISFENLRVPTPNADLGRSPTHLATPIPSPHQNRPLLDAAKTERTPPSRKGLYGAIAAITIVGSLVGVIVLATGESKVSGAADAGSNVVADNGSTTGPGGVPLDPNGTAPSNGTTPSNGTAVSNGTTSSNGTAPTNGSAPSNGAAHTSGTAPANEAAKGAASSNEAAPSKGASPSTIAPSTSTTGSPSKTTSTATSNSGLPRGATTTTSPTGAVTTTTPVAPQTHGNVTIGPGVSVVTTTPPPGTPKRFTKPLDFNPKKFDAMAFAPKALALARQLYPDAGFTRMDVYSVFPSGLADLTIGDDETTYWFRSPANSARPAGIPKNQEVEIFCYVEVEVSAKQIEVSVREIGLDSNCKAPIRPLPKCSLAGVWAQAKGQGADVDTIAKIGFLTDGEWFFDNDGDGYDGLTESFADKCP